MFKIGFGYDAHRLVKGRNLILGGVKIPYKKGLLGHSDADVISHSIGNAILGSLALGDLGEHFPDTDKRYKGISSLKLLSMIKKKIGKAQILHIDSMIVAEEPKMAKHIDRMRKNIADALGISKEKVSIKATTTEGMGFAGRKQGIEAYAVVLLQKGRRL
ncbi:MAG TPA: 2-C-methyl-D-erythritol 2,4-cyclodiphosphate synthase [Terriglobales bacterium]|nr:2-C-methyl-D-erythritol 2,4-cyclodiphosphate synthase [Terriglobales bacterium]